MKEQLSIAFAEPTLYEQAVRLADHLSLAINNEASSVLLVTADKLVLKMPNFSPLFCDFSAKTWQKRRDAGKKQGLVRACKPLPGLRIIDTTAGWGRDAAVLASFGAEVLMLEREPVMASLLRDGLNRQDELSKRNLKLQLIEMDAKDYLETLKPESYPDVIYIDPMHPTRVKKALVKKEMQALQQLIGEDYDAKALLELALLRARKRVVVKWPQQLPPLINPSSSITGKVVRFDLYLSLF